jgi:hypothetical protein
VVSLDGIVRVLLDVMPRRRHQLLEHGRVDRRSVSDGLDRRHHQHPQRPSEEATGRLGVPADREQHVDDLPVLVDRPIDVAPDTVDLLDGPTIGLLPIRQRNRASQFKWASRTHH